MKKYLSGLMVCMMAMAASAQNCNIIAGKWLNKGGQGQVEIAERNGKYYGKLVWVKLPDSAEKHALTDERNIRPELRKRALLGLEILKNFTCNGHTYTNGTIYDPRQGKNFNCIMKLSGNKLTVNGYMGMFLVGSEIWIRAK